MDEQNIAVEMRGLADAITNGADLTARSIKRLDTTITRHNGRLGAIEVWKERITGGKAVISGAWGIASVFLISIIYGLFNMYIQINSLAKTVQDIEVTNKEVKVIIDGIVLQNRE